MGWIVDKNMNVTQGRMDIGQKYKILPRLGWISDQNIKCYAEWGKFQINI